MNARKIILAALGLLIACLFAVGRPLPVQAQAPRAPAQPAPTAQPAPADAAATPAPPLAPAPPATSEGAREHFRRGEAAYQKGNYPLAIEEWTTAYNADPRPRIQYNVYQAHERLGQLGEAVEALQRYLSTADPDDPYYADATARMAALQQRLQATGIRLVGGVDGASINISGHDWGRLPRPDRVPVQPGNHRVIVKLEGYRDFTSNVIVPAGQVVDVPIQIERLAGSDQPLLPNDGAHAAAVDTGISPLPFYIASGVLAAGAIGTAIWMINRSSELDGCDSQFFCSEKDAVTTQRTIALASTITLGAGAVALLIVGVVVGGGDSDSETASACVPTLTGATCRLSF